jgi:acylphosphatase
MERRRLQIIYSGRVQGVGFRYAAKMTARGFDVTGTVRNLSDGRVELIAEGERAELVAFQAAIRESGVGGLIKNEAASWASAAGGLRGFEIIAEI